MSTTLKSADEIGITEEQRINLAALLVFVRDHGDPAIFNIQTYMNDQGSLDPVEVPAMDCNSSACLMGHGPWAGLPARREEDWDDYGRRVFGAASHDNIRDTDRNVLLYNAVFHGTYRTSGMGDALRRGMWVLQHGLPDPDIPVQDSPDTMAAWEAPPDFRPDWGPVEELARLHAPSLNPAHELEH